MTEPTKAKKTFLQRVWDVVFLIFYPILVLFSLLFVGTVYLFSSISWLLSRLLSRPSETASEAEEPTWELWVDNLDLRVERIFVDEVMFGPSYYRLQTLPPSEAVGAHHFGDFQHVCWGGVLLQKWNTLVPKELPNFDLLFFDGKTGDLRYVATIRGSDWRVEDTAKGVLLHWKDGEQDESLTLTEAQVQHDAPILE